MEGVLEVNVSFEYDWHACLCNYHLDKLQRILHPGHQEETSSSKIYGIPALLTRATWKNSITA